MPTAKAMSRWERALGDRESRNRWHNRLRLVRGRAPGAYPRYAPCRKRVLRYRASGVFLVTRPTTPYGYLVAARRSYIYSRATERTLGDCSVPGRYNESDNGETRATEVSARFLTACFTANVSFNFSGVERECG